MNRSEFSRWLVIFSLVALTNALAAGLGQLWQNPVTMTVCIAALVFAAVAVAMLASYVLRNRKESA